MTRPDRPGSPSGSLGKVLAARAASPRMGSTIAFVCEGNAGRSQFAAALAERERDARGPDVEIVSGGVDPAPAIHPEVAAALDEDGIPVGDRHPRAVTHLDLADADVVVTMGCRVDDRLPDGWTGSIERWELDHPTAGDLPAARATRRDRDPRDAAPRRALTRVRPSRIPWVLTSRAGGQTGRRRSPRAGGRRRSSRT